MLGRVTRFASGLRRLKPANVSHPSRLNRRRISDDVAPPGMATGTPSTQAAGGPGSAGGINPNTILWISGGGLGCWLWDIGTLFCKLENQCTYLIVGQALLLQDRGLVIPNNITSALGMSDAEKLAKAEVEDKTNKAVGKQGSRE